MHEHPEVKRTRRRFPWPILAAGVAALALTSSVARAQVPTEAPEHARHAAGPSEPLIPRSLKAEHDGIHEALRGAVRVTGPVGAAARNLERVLMPHFEREEQIALPPLGLLRPLATGAGGGVDPAVAARVLAMSDSLRAELPRMLAEHARIRDAVARLGDAARIHRDTAAAALAAHLALHARSEEEITYPAAVLVGEVLRARNARGPGRTGR